MKLTRLLQLCFFSILLFACQEDSTNLPPSEADYFNDYEPDAMKWGLVDANNHIIVDNVYDDLLDPINDQLIAANLKGKWGFINKDGKTIIPFSYKTVKNFSDNYAFVQLFDNSWKLINQSDKVIHEVKGQSFTQVQEDMFAVKSIKGWQFINAATNDSIDQAFFKVNDFKNGLCIVKNHENYGVINKSGDAVLEFKYDKITHDTEAGRFIGKVGKQYVLINESGKRLDPLAYDKITSSQESTFAYKKDDSWFLSRANAPVTKIEGSKIMNASDGFWLVKKDNLFGVYNNQAKEILTPTYPMIQQFQDSIAVVMKDKSNWNYINAEGQELLPFDLPIAFDFKNGYARIATPDGVMFLNKSGKLMKNLVFPEIKDFHNGLARFQDYPKS